MKNFILIGILLTASLHTAIAQDLNILFMGNSFTQRHNLRLLVKEVFEEGQPGSTVNVEQSTYGGQDMFRHHDLYFSETMLRLNTITEAEVEEKIAAIQAYLDAGEPPEFYAAYWEKTGLDPVDWSIVERNLQTAVGRQRDIIERIERDDRVKWDYVVLQSWKDVVDDIDAGYGEYVQKFARLAEQEGVKVILYATAPHAQNAISVTAPLELARTEMELNTIRHLSQRIEASAVVPVALALKNIQVGGTDLVFRYVNDMHPNQYAAFLTANMFYAAVFQQSPEGFHFNTVVETKVDEDGKDPDGGDAQVIFDDATKIFIQQAAYDAAMEFYAGHK